MSLISSNSHRNGAGNLHHGVLNPPAHFSCRCIETVLADSWMIATVSYATMGRGRNAICDELSSDAARAHRWRPARPGLFFVFYVTKRPV